MIDLSRRDHHDPGGGFRNPWPAARQPVFTGMLRWTLTRMAKPRIDRTRRGGFPSVTPRVIRPRAADGRASLTWIGHATYLIQIAGLNVLTDPVWSERCSPVRFAGPRRFMPPGIRFDELPPIDLVLISHDHYDHLDSGSVARLARRHGNARWLAPLGLSAFLKQRGVSQVDELDWGDAVDHAGAGISCVPAQHFSGRSVRRNRSLWCGWALSGEGRRVYFVGDTGYHPDFAAIGRLFGPFDVVLMPIGAYDPRWFMAPVHIDPEEAVTAHLELTAAAGRFCPLAGMHWGTFKLTDEPMTEPPQRARAAWQGRNLPSGMLWIMQHGETRRIPAS